MIKGIVVSRDVGNICEEIKNGKTTRERISELFFMSLFFFLLVIQQEAQAGFQLVILWLQSLLSTRLRGTGIITTTLGSEVFSLLVLQRGESCNLNH